MNIPTTADIRNELKEKYARCEFREGKYGKTVEIQNAHFLADKDWIIRKPNYDYAKREIEWYESQSLYVKDIPGGAPKIWQACADRDGKIKTNEDPSISYINKVDLIYDLMVVQCYLAYLSHK